MLRILGRARKACDGVTRRRWLEVGGAGLFGLTASHLLAAEPQKATKRPRAKSVMFVYLFGGPSQLESFDMKPDGPSHVRGPFKRIASRSEGLHVCEHLPRLAQRSNKYAVVRTVNHPQNDHNASHYIQTGHPMPPAERGPSNVNAAPNDWPSLGSMVSHWDQTTNKRSQSVPSYMYIPNRHGEIQLGGQYDRLGQYAGWLGREYNAIATRVRKRRSGDNPYYRNCNDSELNYQIPGLKVNPAVTIDRLNRRRSLLQQFDEGRRQLLESHQPSRLAEDREVAWNLLTTGKLHRALDVRREPKKLRDQYGRNLFGQSLIAGRRMIEAGARFVTVIWDMTDGAVSGWDSHSGLTGSLKNHLLPGLDQGMAALLDDMGGSGLLNETLVVCTGEMGRTPRFQNRGSSDGRDHWSYCFPSLLAGAGVQGGLVYGKSDHIAAYPATNPVSPEDLSCTIFESLGIDPHGFIQDKQNRPVKRIDGGRSLPLFG